VSFPAMKSGQVKVRKSRSTRSLKAAKPQITSLLDIMTCLLIYLLTSFSAEGEIATTTKNLELPESSAKKKPHLTVVIAVTNDYILAEGKKVAEVDRILATDDMAIPELSDWLADRRTTTEKIAQYSTTTQFKGDVTIQADKRIRFRLLKKIMYTCGQEGFNNFSLAVQQRGN